MLDAGERTSPNVSEAMLEFVQAAAALPVIETRWALVEHLHDARSGCVAAAGGMLREAWTWFIQA